MDQLLKLSEISEIGISECQTLELDCHGRQLELILLCSVKGNFRVYLNKCPHTGVNLNWQDNQCFDSEGSLLMCSLHGALFQPEDGFCIYGPCKGQSLQGLPLIIEDGVIYLDLNTVENIVDAG